jgi:hypothetical protein
MNGTRYKLPGLLLSKVSSFASLGEVGYLVFDAPRSVRFLDFCIMNPAF